MGVRTRTILVALALAAGQPGVAQAHLMATGMGPIYDGVIHFGLSPEDYLPVIALAFFAGLRGSPTVRRLLWVLPMTWLCGAIAALAGLSVPAGPLSWTTPVMFLVIGGGLAANLEISETAAAVVAAAFGGLRGVADISGVNASLPHLASLADMVASAVVVFAIAASLALPLKRPWMVIAMRVSGSWLAASGLLLAGWVWRYGTQIAGS